MLRRRDPPAFHWIIVQILQLLAHHRIIRDNLRMRTFLPNLVLVGFMSPTVITKLIQNPFPVLVSESFQNLGGGKALQIAQHRRQIGRGEDGVEVIVEYNPGINLQHLVLSAVFE